jgi:hypothetical protein
MILSPERFRDLDARNTRNRIYWAANADFDRSGASSMSAETSAATPEECRISNDERGELELHHFMTEAPLHLFAYVTKNRKTGAWQCNAWPGQPFGRVWVGDPYKSPGFYGRPSTRRSVTLFAVNGWIYSGTFYQSSGDYARLKRTKQRVSPVSQELSRRSNFGPGNI